MEPPAREDASVPVAASAAILTGITSSEAAVALNSSLPAIPRPRFRPVRQPEAGQRHAREAEPEFLQRRAAGDGLGQAFGEFIEFVVHNSLFGRLAYCFFVCETRWNALLYLPLDATEEDAGNIVAVHLIEGRHEIIAYSGQPLVIAHEVVEERGPGLLHIE